MQGMRQVLFVGAALSVAACGGNEMEAQEPLDLGQSQAPLMMAKPGLGIPNQYIVVVKKGNPVQSTMMAAGVSARRTFAVINGFAADLSQSQVEALRNDPSVEYIEQNQVVKADVTQRNVTWGIDRIDQAALPLSTTYFYGVPAFGINAYIIDTGIQASHPEFGGRAANVFDAFGGNGDDCNGHGTHVAGTVGSLNYGVAKGSFLLGVRVLNCSGSGSIEGVIAGVDWVRTNHVSPAVANMSLGGGSSPALNTAVNNLSDSGVFVAVAAGNSAADACGYSPAGAANVTTVAASTSTDDRATYSNYGGCVDVYGPGSGITSTWIGSGTNTISGTSMASPHVAGVAALYKDNFGDAPSATVDAWIKANATPNVVKNNPAGTPNLLLFNSWL
jgi:subtilisin family serine protease